MAEQTTSRWAEIRTPTLETPRRRARYERTKKQVLVTRRILQEIDAERERRGMTKAALAQEIGMTPSVVRRMFSSEVSNPGLVTVIAMLAALDLDVVIEGPSGTRQPTGSAKERTSADELVTA